MRPRTRPRLGVVVNKVEGELKQGVATGKRDGLPRTAALRTAAFWSVEEGAHDFRATLGRIRSAGGRGRLPAMEILVTTE